MLLLAISFLLLLALSILLAIHPSLLQPLLSFLPTTTTSSSRPTTHHRLPTLTNTSAKLLQPPKIPINIKPYLFPPLRPKSTSRTGMGLKRLEASNWLTLDSSYLSEHIQRLSLLSSRREDVLQCLPGSQEACTEVLDIVVGFLCERFPGAFRVFYKLPGRDVDGKENGNEKKKKYVKNFLTGEEYMVGEGCHEPLEIAARLAMEDFNILMRDPESGEYCLKASATLFPAGWKLRERIGFSMQMLHGPVPGWKENLGRSVNRYFTHLSPKTAMERTNLFIQTTPHLFQDSPESPSPPSSSPSPSLISPSPPPSPLSPKTLIIRRERQTFTRLPRSDAILFTVRTYMQPLVSMQDKEEISALRSQILGWEEEVRMYKGWEIWGEVLVRWCEEQVGVGGDEAKGEGNEKKKGGAEKGVR